MQLNIEFHDRELEESLRMISQEQGKEVKDLVLETLKRIFVKKKNSPTLHYRTLDIQNHFYRPEKEEKKEKDEEEMVIPFADVKDSVTFAKQLREKAWK